MTTLATVVDVEQYVLAAGGLRHRINIEKRSTVQDSGGQPLLEWTPVKTLKARVEPIAGREYFTADQFAPEVTTRILIRFTTAVDEGMRALFLGVYYDIKTVLDIQFRHRWIIMMCESGVSSIG